MTAERVADEQDWASYARAVIDVAPSGRPPFRLVPDVLGVTGMWPQDQVVPVMIITAWNPDSMILQRADNHARNQLLVAELDRPGVTFWPAVGRDLGSRHHEVGVAVCGLSLAEGVALGARHGQASIFVWTPDALAVVSCTSDRCHTSGWRLEDLPLSQIEPTSV